MVFSSIVFLCVFLPITFILHTILPGIRAKNILLIVASLIFYAYGEPVYILLMLLSSAVNYIIARLVDKYEGKRRRAFLCVSIFFNIGMLCVFKYTDMIISSINSITGLGISEVGLALPIGISFYTFQIISYVVDVYRKTISDFCCLCLFFRN